jgi:hypothetical protein
MPDEQAPGAPAPAADPSHPEGEGSLRATWGPRVAWAGLLVAVGLGWLYAWAAQPGYPGRHYYYGYWLTTPVWYRAGYLAGTLGIAGVAAGLLTSGWREFFRNDFVARLLALAEWRQIRAGRGLAGRLLWLLVAGFGWVSVAFILATDSGYQTNDFAALMAIAYAAYSGVLAVSLGVSGAVRLAASRSSGAAENLLMAPRAADHLAWASAHAHFRRAPRSLLAMPPYCLMGALMIAKANGLPIGYAFLGTIAVLISEFLLLRIVTALGSWSGAAGRSPGVAGAGAAVGSLLLWVGRCLLMLAGFAILLEIERGSGRDYVSWALGGSLAALFLACTLLVPLLQWSARLALAKPAGLVVGGWLRQLGTWLIACGERLEGAAETGPRRPQSPMRPTSTSLGNSRRRELVARWVRLLMMGSVLVALFPLTGEMTQGDGSLSAVYLYWWCAAFAATAIYLGPMLVRSLTAMLRAPPDKKVP